MLRFIDFVKNLHFSCNNRVILSTNKVEAEELCVTGVSIHTIRGANRIREGFRFFELPIIRSIVYVRCLLKVGFAFTPETKLTLPKRGFEGFLAFYTTTWSPFMQNGNVMVPSDAEPLPPAQRDYFSSIEYLVAFFALPTCAIPEFISNRFPGMYAGGAIGVGHVRNFFRWQ